MTKQELLALTGSMEQAASVRLVEFQDGRANGLRGWRVHNGLMEFDVMADKCLDIPSFRYRGVGFHFLAKPGLMGRSHFDTNGAEAQRSIMGGLLFTSGLENICAPCTIGEKDYPMHGRIRTTPAEHCGADAAWEGDRYLLRVFGEMREAELFGENLMLRRHIETVYGENTVRIIDEIENQSFREEPVMLLYHINFGYPFLSPGCRVILPVLEVTARDEFAQPGIDNWDIVPVPAPNVSEQVFLHRLGAYEDGKTFAAIVNPDLRLGMKICFNKNDLPYFMQWKSIASGDYVIGLEPANSSVFGRVYHEEKGDLHTLGPQCSERHVLTLQVLEEDEIEALQLEADRLVQTNRKGSQL